MALQDLTPQLRTRLSRMERLVGWFITIATLLLVAGLVFYVYQMAKRKGWFLIKLPYYTFVQGGAGLRVGTPIRLMGFDVGEITVIDTMPPDDPFNVFVQFRVREPYFGYLWEDSRAKVVAADFLGNRYIEVTKGTNGPPTYIFHELRQVSLAEARSFVGNPDFVLGQDVYNVSNDLVLRAFAPLSSTNFAVLDRLQPASLQVINKAMKLPRPTALWNEQTGTYEPFTKDTKGYWLRVEESPALTERLENVVNTVEAALPEFLALTNKLAAVLTNSANLVAHADELLVQAQPVVTNAARITANLSEAKGSLGEWLIPTNLNRQLQDTLQSANAAVATAQTNVNAVSSNLLVSLENLAGITSNLNAQVQANGFVLHQISELIIHTDEMVQGLKRHWLLRSAFRGETNEPLQSIVTPRAGGAP